jgi:hypothetical protein
MYSWHFKKTGDSVMTPALRFPGHVFSAAMQKAHKPKL